MQPFLEKPKPARHFLPEEQKDQSYRVIDMLDRCGVPYESWGRGTSQSLMELMRTLREDQVAIAEISGDKPLLIVSNAVVYVQFLGEEHLYELYEAYQQFNNGGVLKRDFRGISETMRVNETTTGAARRALAEEPGYSEPGFRDPANYTLCQLPGQILGPMPSEKWPGLMAEFHRQIWRCSIDRGIFREDGYFEMQKKKMVVFQWRIM